MHNRARMHACVHAGARLCWQRGNLQKGCVFRFATLRICYEDFPLKAFMNDGACGEHWQRQASNKHDAGHMIYACLCLCMWEHIPPEVFAAAAQTHFLSSCLADRGAAHSITKQTKPKGPLVPRCEISSYSPPQQPEKQIHYSPQFNLSKVTQNAHACMHARMSKHSTSQHQYCE